MMQSVKLGLPEYKHVETQEAVVDFKVSDDFIIRCSIRVVIIIANMMRIVAFESLSSSSSSSSSS